MAEHKEFVGLLYARDPMIPGLVQLVIKTEVGGPEQVITIPAMRAAKLGALLCDMGITINERKR